MSWDGKMYDKYRIVHTDGTPLNGKKYFVLRLDSDNPVEAARVAAAMRAYKSEPRNCDVYTADELKVIFNSELVLELPIANEHEKNLVTITAMGVIDTLFATTKEGGAK